MKKLLFLPLLLLVVLSACKGDKKASGDTDSFKNGVFTSVDGLFSISFPEEPVFSEENIETGLGDIRMASYIHEVSDNKAYMVAYSDYPSMLINLAGKEELLQGAKQGALASLNIDNVFEERVLNKDGHTGLYFSGNDGEDYHIEYEMYLKENRLYQVAIIESSGKIGSDTDKKFFSSFKLN